MFRACFLITYFSFFSSLYPHVYIIKQNERYFHCVQGLERKFLAEPFRSLLLNTRSRELVHTPMRGSTDYWTGRVDKKTGNISGENNMGKLLMEVRRELQRAKQYTENEENKDEIEKNKVVDEKEGDTEMDDNDTTQDSSGYQGTKRKHQDDNVDGKHDGEEPDGPKIKRKKTETESKDDVKRKAGSSEIKDKSDDENKGDDRNNAVEKNTGHEVAKRH